MMSDEVLMLEFQRGSRVAFEELYARYCGPLYGFFRRRLESPQRAEDLTQETFLAVIRGASHYEPRALVRTYFYGIALKLVAVEHRQRNQDPLPEEFAPEAAAHSADDNALWVRQAIAKLDDSEREILMLREYEQLTYAEIGKLLWLPINTVRSRLFRARLALRQHLVPKETARGGVRPGGAQTSAPVRAAEDEA